MNRLLYKILFSTAFLTSCDFSENVHSVVEKGRKEATIQMENDMIKSRKDFEDTYVKSISDNLNVKSIPKLKVTLDETSAYIDSLIKVLNTVDDNIVKNLSGVESVFSVEISDSLYHLINNSYSQTIMHCSDTAIINSLESKRKEILCDFDSSHFRKFFFINRNSKMVAWTLVAIETELYNNAATAIKSYR